jgi:hypothetical protein
MRSAIHAVISDCAHATPPRRFVSESLPADEVVNGGAGQAAQMHHFGQTDKALLNGIRDRHQRAAGAEDGEEKAVCIGLPHKVHTVPVVSVRLRVALYFVNIFLRATSLLCRTPTTALI